MSIFNDKPPRPKEIDEWLESSSLIPVMLWSVAFLWITQTLFSLVPFFQDVIMYLNPAGLYAMFLPSHFSYLSGLYQEDAIGLQMGCLTRAMTVVMAIMAFVYRGRSFYSMLKPVIHKYFFLLKRKLFWFLVLGGLYFIKNTFIDGADRVGFEGGSAYDFVNFLSRGYIFMFSYGTFVSVFYLAIMFYLMVLSQLKKKEFES